MTPEQKACVLRMLEEYKVGVVATRGKGEAPESAVVTISYDTNGVIYFGSLATHRKNQNIAYNPHVSFVIGWDTVVRETLQCEGIASVVLTDEREAVARAHCLRHPAFAVYTDNPSFEYIRIQPTWIRYTNMAHGAPGSWEVRIESGTQIHTA